MIETSDHAQDQPPKRLLTIKDLKIHFYTKQGIVKAVDGINLIINEGETFCLVGESGSGKTITALSILRLLPSPPARIVSGEILFKNHNLLRVSEEIIRNFRGDEITFVSQDPTTSLNPLQLWSKSL